MGILDFLRGVFGGAVREGAEARKQERLNFQAVNQGWSVYAAAMSNRASALETDIAAVMQRERVCQSLLSAAGQSIGEAHDKIAALTRRVAELERR